MDRKNNILHNLEFGYALDNIDDVSRRSAESRGSRSAIFIDRRYGSDTCMYPLSELFGKTIDTTCRRTRWRRDTYFEE